MPLIRGDLDAIPSYVPGRNPVDLARELGLPDAIKLASNEVPYGPLPGVAEAVAEAAAQLHRYPDPAASKLREALAERHGLRPTQLVTGCGSVALAEHLVRAVATAGDEIVHAWRSFEAYPVISAVTGLRSVTVPLTDDHRHDLSALARRINERTRVVLLCSPNNPTGPALTGDELVAFLDAVPPDVLVVIDEAYREFVTDPDVPDGLTVAAGRPNVAVLRTFSKAWGLAGIRVGWLAADEPLAAAVRKVLTPFSTSSPAQAAALAALRQEAEVRRRVAVVVAERDRVLAATRQALAGVPDSQANFVWLPLGDLAMDFAASCERRGVIVRAFAGDGVRVTIGTPAENDAFLNVLDAELSPTRSAAAGG